MLLVTRKQLVQTVVLAFLLVIGGLINPAPPAGAEGTVIAWGYNEHGQLDVPPGLSNPKAISAGGHHSLAINGDGTVWAWGNNLYGQTNVPPGLSNVKTISAGGGHSLALKEDGTVVAWGANYNGEGSVPAGLKDVKAVSAGWAHNLALKEDGTVVAWGWNGYGQTNVPDGLSTVRAISAGGFHNLALKEDGTVVAWGCEEPGNPDNHGQAEVPAGLTGVKAVAGGAFHSLVLKEDGTVAAWGHNGYGQTNVPVGLSNVEVISAGGYQNLAVTSGGSVIGWGYNQWGQAEFPRGLSKPKAISAGHFFNLALVEPEVIPEPPSIEPQISGILGNDGWYRGPVTVSWNVSDHGLATSSQSGCDPTTIDFDTSGTTLTCTATSIGGTSSESVTVKRDATEPTLLPTVSPNPILLNGSGKVSPNAADNPSGMASSACDALDTNSVGEKTVTCGATDNAGNLTSKTVTYQVTYGISPLYDSSKATKMGSTFPIKLQLVDAAGNNRSSRDINLAALSVSLASNDAPGILDDSGNANPDNNFRYEPSLGTTGGYIFNLSTKGLTSGTHYLSFKAGNDPMTHRVQFQVK